MNWLKKCFTKDITFSLSFVGAVIACLLGRVDAQFINVKVVLSLFGLMVVIEALKEMGTLSHIAHKITYFAKSKRHLVQALVALSFVASMVLTNDVTILTVLPIFFMIAGQTLGRRETLLGTVYIILAANLGSGAFPTGSPHNIFLYSYYHLDVFTFFSWMWLFCLLSALILWALSLLIANEPFASDVDGISTMKSNIPTAVVAHPEHKKAFNEELPTLHQQVPVLKHYTPLRQRLLPYLGLGIMLAHVMNFVHSGWWVAAAVICVLIPFPYVIKKVDYLLLLTFVCFFMIVGNLGQNQHIATFLHDSVHSYKETLWVSAWVSQVISNVPASLLLAPFTEHAKAMVIGANIGGMGTLIASLANLIGYKVFISYYPKERIALLKYFSVINFGLLGIYLVVFSLL